MTVNKIKKNSIRFFGLAGLALSLSACAETPLKTVDVGTSGVKESADSSPTDSSLLEKTKAAFLGTDEPLPIGVNPALWRATLDTLVFVPIVEADPFGGTITTDWSTPPGIENERFKLNILLRSQKLRADGVLVKLFRQEWREGRGWVDIPSSQGADEKIRNAILTRARQTERARLENNG